MHCFKILLAEERSRAAAECPSGRWRSFNSSR